MSPHAIFKAKHSKYAPNLTGLSIAQPSKPFESVTFAASKQATLIAFFSTQMAHMMCKPYLEAVEKAFPSHPSLGIVRIQHETHWAKMALVKYLFVKKYIRPLYTPEQQVSPRKWPNLILANVYFDEKVCQSFGRGGNTYYEYTSGICPFVGQRLADSMDGDGHALGWRIGRAETRRREIDWSRIGGS